MSSSVENSVAKLLYRVENFHWSPLHPSKYVIPADNGVVKGVGLVAHKDYAAFNLAWGICSGQWQSDFAQTQLVTAFVAFQQYTAFKIAGEPFGDYLTVIQPSMVPGLMKFRDNTLTPEMQNVVMKAARLADALKG